MTEMTFATQTSPGIVRVRRLAMFWGIAGAMATTLVLPYALALNPMLLSKIHVGLPLFFLTQFLQSLVLFTSLSWAGLRLGTSIGFGSPIAFALVFRGTESRLPTKTLAGAFITGIAAGATLLMLDRVFKPFMPNSVLTTPVDIDLWKRFLTCFYGGITEELICRLFLLTLLVWLIGKATSNHGSPPKTWMIWTGIVGAAVLFGIGHLPATAMVWPLTPLVVARTLLLNAAGGVVFGWLYYRRGLEHAMVAHFAADLILHVVAGS